MVACGATHRRNATRRRSTGSVRTVPPGSSMRVIAWPRKVMRELASRIRCSHLRCGEIFALTQLHEPGDELAVNRVGTDQRRWTRPAARVDQRGFALPAPETPMAPDELLERRHVMRAVVDPAVDDEVPDVVQRRVASD